MPRSTPRCPRPSQYLASGSAAVETDANAPGRLALLHPPPVSSSIHELRECVDETSALTMLSFVTHSQHVTPHTATRRPGPARPGQSEPSSGIAPRFV